MDKSPNNELKEEKERIRERKDAQLIIFFFKWPTSQKVSGFPNSPKEFITSSPSSLQHHVPLL